MYTKVIDSQATGAIKYLTQIFHVFVVGTVRNKCLIINWNFSIQFQFQISYLKRIVIF